MPPASIVLIALLVHLVAAAGMDIRCPKGNFRHALPGTSCHQYYVCRGPHDVERHVCPAATHFSPGHKVCKVGGRCYDIVCAGRVDGRYSDTIENCSRWYECQGGAIVRLESCPMGQQFSEELGGCVRAEKAECPQPKSTAGLATKTFNHCDAEKDGLVAVGNGAVYVRCHDHREMETLSCPPGQAFDGHGCGDPQQANNVCENLAPGYYTDPESNCRAYYYCAKSTKITYVCPSKELFNGAVCVPRDEFKCPNINIECSNRPNGYQRAERSLQNYIYCSDGDKLATLQCDPDKAYDGEKCVNVKHFRSACHNVRYGYLTDDACRLYYVCRDETVVKSGLCAHDFAFDGNSCVPKTAADCDRGSLKTCKGAPNGFYQDFNSNCRKYFFCINGEKTALSCPPGQVHNGDLCVRSHKFECPTTKITEYLNF